MVFVKRDSKNVICALFDKQTEEHLEELSSESEEVSDFLARCILDKNVSFLKSDLELIRVIEDLVHILMEKNVISITDFPVPVIEKLVSRKKIRVQFENVAKIINK